MDNLAAVAAVKLVNVNKHDLLSKYRSALNISFTCCLSFQQDVLHMTVEFSSLPSTPIKDMVIKQLRCAFRPDKTSIVDTKGK